MPAEQGLPSPPEEWPLEIQESYTVLRRLGKGGFASVMLATPTKEKQKEQQHQQQKKTTTTNSRHEVAIKVVGGIVDPADSHRYGLDHTGAQIQQQRVQAILYARREITILQQLDHPNIVHLYDHWLASSSTSAAAATTTTTTTTTTRRNSRSAISDRTAAVLVLEYAKGPTVDSLLQYGGALSTNFGRIVIAQIIDAVAYLHRHAVLHRDIKPDNILVTGAYGTDDFIWENPPENTITVVDTIPTPTIPGPDEEAQNTTTNSQSQEEYWQRLRTKYKVTLIDFGFARALTPHDTTSTTPHNNNNPHRQHPQHEEDTHLASYHRIYHDHSQEYTTRHSTTKKKSGSNAKQKKKKGEANHDNDEDEDALGSSEHSTKNKSVRKHIRRGTLDSSMNRMLSMRYKNTTTTSRTMLLKDNTTDAKNEEEEDEEEKDELRTSMSHKMKRTMSALGNRNYAAPEIINKVRPQYRPRTEPKLGTDGGATATIAAAATTPTTTTTTKQATTDTISTYVADYGLLVDSFSLGHTIRYMMTGVQPGISIEDAIFLQTGGWIGTVCAWLCSCGGTTTTTNNTNATTTKNTKTKRTVQYRRTEDLPTDVCRLIGSLTQLSEHKRLSVRKARWNVPWIADVLDGNDTAVTNANNCSSISYLPFATDDDD